MDLLDGLYQLNLMYAVAAARSEMCRAVFMALTSVLS